MAATLDQTGDVTRQDLHRFAKLYVFPTYVKQADTAKTLNHDESLPSTAYADVRFRQFPCHTKAATWVSCLFFLEKQAELHPKIAEFISERLAGFADDWGIAKDIRELREKVAEVNREHLPDSAYMRVWVDTSGNKQRDYPLRSAMEVKAAADWFGQHRYHFPFDERKVMASRLLEKANAFAASLDDNVDEMLERQAGRGTYAPEKVAEALRDRALVPGCLPELAEGLRKLAQTVESNPYLATCPDSAAGLCATVDTFDRATGLVEAYGPLIPPPEDLVFATAYKTARAAIDESCMLITGAVYNKNDFSRLKVAEIRDAFGDVVADDVANGLMVDPDKMAEVAATFPRPDAQLLDNVLTENAIFPMLKHATAVARPDHDTLRQLASIHDFMQHRPA